MTGSTPSHDAYDNPRTWVPRVTRLLDRQLGLYARLDELSKSQTAHIEGDETDALLGVLARRQTVIEEITGVNAELGPFRDRWESLARALNDDEKSQLRGRFEALETLVNSISQRDEEDRRTLEQRRRSVGSELESLTRGRGAVAAYGSGGVSKGGGARFQDRQV